MINLKQRLFSIKLGIITSVIWAGVGHAYTCPKYVTKKNYDPLREQVEISGADNSTLIRCLYTANRPQGYLDSMINGGLQRKNMSITKEYLLTDNQNLDPKDIDPEELVAPGVLNKFINYCQNARENTGRSLVKTWKLILRQGVDTRGSYPLEHGQFTCLREFQNDSKTTVQLEIFGPDFSVETDY